MADLSGAYKDFDLSYNLDTLTRSSHQLMR